MPGDFQRQPSVWRLFQRQYQTAARTSQGSSRRPSLPSLPDVLPPDRPGCSVRIKVAPLSDREREAARCGVSRRPHTPVRTRRCRRNPPESLVGRQGEQAQLASEPWTVGLKERIGARKPLVLRVLRHFGVNESPAMAGDRPRWRPQSARGVRIWEGRSGRGAPDEVPSPFSFVLRANRFARRNASQRIERRTTYLPGLPREKIRKTSWVSGLRSSIPS
jgi:hypothetical protein